MKIDTKQGIITLCVAGLTTVPNYSVCCVVLTNNNIFYRQYPLSRTHTRRRPATDKLPND